VSPPSPANVVAEGIDIPIAFLRVLAWKLWTAAAKGCHNALLVSRVRFPPRDSDAKPGSSREVPLVARAQPNPIP